MTAYNAQFERYPAAQGAAQPARNALAVSPSDTKDLTDATGDAMPMYAKALYIGVAGDVTVVMAGDRSNSGDGTGVLFKAHPVGYLPGQVRRVMATGTTATNILALLDA